MLRAAGGAVAIDVPISHWLYVLTILLALFLALSKRRHELVLLADGATGHRRILEEYSPYLLDQMISVVDGVHAGRLRDLHRQPGDGRRSSARTGLGLTLPFPLYGIFRYLYLVHQKEGGRQSVGNAADRPAAARLRGALGRDRRPHHLRAARLIQRNHGTNPKSQSSARRPATVLRGLSRR